MCNHQIVNAFFVFRWKKKIKFWRRDNQEKQRRSKAGAGLAGGEYISKTEKRFSSNRFRLLVIRSTVRG